MGGGDDRREDRGALAWGWIFLWGVFVAYAAFVAPPDDPALTRSLVRGDFARVDPSIAAVFSMLGVVPALASAFVLRDGADRRLPAWPFALGMFVVGAFALLPWLALRGAFGPREPPRPPGPVRRALARPVTAWAIFAALGLLTGWAITAGNAAAYAAAFRSTSMVHVMTIDLVVCAVLLFVLVGEADAEQEARPPRVLDVLRAVPLFGPALWNALVRRDP